MRDAIRIRPARGSDRHTLLRLWVELVEHHRKLAPDLPGADPRPEALRGEIDRGLDSPSCRVLLAEVSEEAVGFLFAEVESRGQSASPGAAVGWLHETYVRPDSRRRGVADALVRASLAWLHERGVGRVSVRIEATNPEALGFWRRLGFEERARVLERPSSPC
jgi:GNAT superfamily N-acetyltransferase